MRALYIALAHVISELRYLHYGLSAVLAFAGLKMIVPDQWVHVPPLISALVILVCIGAAVAASLWSRARTAPGARPKPRPPRPGEPAAPGSARDPGMAPRDAL